MRPGAKAAVVIVSIVGGGALLLAGLATAVIYGLHGINLSGLSASPAPVVMHDDAALARRHYVSTTLQCRLRFPAGPHTLKTGLTRDPHCEGDFVAGQPGRSITIVRADRGATSFDWYVRQNRDGLAHSSSISNVVLRGEGRCTIQGVNGYAITLTCTTSGKAMEQRLVMLDAPSHKVYILLGTSLIEEWGNNAEILDSSLSTFEIGSFMEEPPDAAEEHPLPPVPHLSLAPERPAPPTARPQPDIDTPPAPGITVEPSRPRPGALHISFANASEAVHYLQSGQEAEQQMALMYLARGPADAGARAEVVAAILPLLEDEKRCLFAAKAIGIWARPDDAPQLRQELTRIRQRDPEGRSAPSMFSLNALIELLGKSADADSARVLADCLRQMRVRSRAHDALKTMGAAGEDAVLGVLDDSDPAVVRDAVELLGDIGTARSIAPLQQLANGSNRLLSPAARAALQHVQSRLQNAP